MLLRNRQIHTEAAEWFVELEESADFHQRQSFDAWLRRSPEHVQAFLELLPVWERSGRKRADAPDAEALIAQALGGNTSVVSLSPFREAASHSPRRRVRLYAAVAGSMVCAVAALVWWQPWNATTYTTGVGELRSLVLEDGTALELNAHSKVRIRFTDTERRVELLEGQALFDVAEDAARPFAVRSELARVQVLGTRFDVNRRRLNTTVSVLEGRVAVSPPGEAAPLYLSAGEQAVATAGALTPARPANVADATAWMHRQLMFQKTALGDVVEEFNRYNARQLRIRDAQLEGFLVSGTFVSTDPASFIRFLGQLPAIRIEERRGEILIGVRRDISGNP